MKFFFTILLSLVLGTAAASALDLALAAGTLSSRLTPAEASSETVLRLSGAMDASDFYFIDKHMPSLAVLDLSKVSIVGYKGEPINGISTFPADMIPPSALAGKQITELILPAAGSVSVGDFAFASTAISTLDLPESVKSVGMGAFSACKSLVRVSGKGAGIGDFAFSACTSLAEVSLGGVTSLGASAFDGCSSLSGVGGCGELTEIGNRAFAGTQALKEFTFSEKLRSIGSEAFLASAIETVRLAECVALRSIGDWAFACNGSLITATVPENVSAIGNGVFFACPALVSLSLPVSL
ncbi:MAG: leucine-rich repeat domain-containing protein, partial [Muribaculaceae bacterium]|nr:leucine-rich repeat domain-containing protein [Muribaculaceae bacterium]